MFHFPIKSIRFFLQDLLHWHNISNFCGNHFNKCSTYSCFFILSWARRKVCDIEKMSHITQLHFFVMGQRGRYNHPPCLNCFIVLRVSLRHECDHYMQEMTGWKDMLSGYCQFSHLNQVSMVSPIYDHVWTTAAAHGRVSRLSARSHVPPFQAFEKLILRQTALRRQRRKKHGRGRTGIQMKAVVYVCLSTETEVKEEKEVDLSFDSTPSFNPSPFFPLPSSISRSLKSRL